MEQPHNVPHALPRIHVSRPRLLQELSRAVQCKLSVISADAGYGKSTLAAEFVQSAGLRAEWHQFSAADRDLSILAEHLEECLRRLTGEPRAAKKARGRRAGSPSVVGLAEFLLKLAARVDARHSILVLDDYHAVEEVADVNRLLGSLIEGSPDNLHFLVLSRSVPRLPLARMRARQELATLEEEDLAFTLEETAQFLGGDTERELDAAAPALVQERTEGWVAGIAMVSQSLRYGNPDKVMAVLTDPTASAWLAYDYLADEVFDGQDPCLQEFLVRTSVLSRMTVAACDHLLCTSTSELTLLHLEDRGLFTISVDPSRRTFRYHQLFREFLLQKLRQRETPEAICALHRRAARFHEAEELWRECVHHYLKAGDAVEAARVIEANGERYIFSGFLHTVEHWLQALPEDLLETRPRLLALKGQLSHHMAVRHDESLRLLEKTFRLFQAQGDQEGVAWTAGEMAYVRQRAGQVQQAIHLLSSGLAIAGEGTVLKSELLVMQGQAFRDSGMLAQSAEACMASLEQLAGGDDDPRRLRGQSRADRNLALTRLEMGELDGALRMAQQALAFCRGHQIGDYEEGWCLAMLGVVLWANADFEEAIQVLNRALSLSTRYTRHLQHFIAAWLGNSLRDSGRYAEAEHAYGLGTDGAALERAYLHAMTHHGQAALDAAQKLFKRFGRSESIPNRTTAEVILAVALRNRGDLSAALEHARESARLLSTSGYRLRLASALVHQARIELDLCRQSEARDTLQRAFGLASADRYYHFFWWDQELVASSCAMALAEDLHADYAAELALRRLDPGGAASLIPLLQHRRVDVRRRVQALLSSLGQGVPEGIPLQILTDCADQRLRKALAEAIGEGTISARGVQTLRVEHGLSWREIEIFAEYYLKSIGRSASNGPTLRSSCAVRLSISDKTVRCHVNNIRRKLGLPAWLSGTQVVEWADQEGLLPAIGRSRSAVGVGGRAQGLG